MPSTSVTILIFVQYRSYWDNNGLGSFRDGLENSPHYIKVLEEIIIEIFLIVQMFLSPVGGLMVIADCTSHR